MRSFFLALLLANYILVSSSSSSSSIPPNILFILLDDVGAADIGFSAKLHGEQQPAIPTPHIDSLASSGLVLTRYYTHMICGPSRSSLLTGRSAYSLGNPFPRLGNHGGLDPSFNTLADELSARNYNTAMVGKWGVDYPTEYLTPNAPNKNNVQFVKTPGLGPTSRGFDHFFGLYASAHNHYTKEVVFKNAVDLHSHNFTEQSFVDYPELDAQKNVYSTDLFTAEASRIIRETWSTERPSFLYLSYTAPHDPLQSPPPSSSVSPKCALIPNWRRRVYCEMLSSVDASVGVLLSVLSSSRLLSNTIVVLTSDNGGLPAGGGINAPFRGVKGTPYEGGVRVPAVLTWGLAGGMATAGETFDELFHVSDWAPTLLGIVDERRGERTHRHDLLDVGGAPIDGKDHSRRILDGAKVVDKSGAVRSELLLEYNAVMGHTAFISGDYKLLLGNLGRSSFFGEPRGRWVDADSRPFYIFEEVLCNGIDWGLGPNWFPFANALRLYFDYLLHCYSGDPHADDIRRNIEGKKLGDVMPVGEENLPRADWELFDKGFKERVQLYNLKEDPFEKVNLAGEKRDIVDDMATRAAFLVKSGPVAPVQGQHLSLVIQFKGFADFMVKVLKAGVVASVSLIVMFGVLIMKRGGKKSNGGREKQE